MDTVALPSAVTHIVHKTGLCENTVYDLLHNGWEFVETFCEPDKWVSNQP